ncbi:hypothetical protein NDU88_006006 [Pleurodeles waltl]|uniref:Lamina-associated polypeptide 2 alpha C-terminal domain-containing protein n=1 Tax=Pleurodeles waltl TaxID=8319 RepID=A0AAV7WC59_PLEWA|nr:hypothetical protein NDU88_006006 [Pleurodeles waltl]
MDPSPASEGSGDPVVTPSRCRSPTLVHSLSTPGLEAKLRAGRKALRLLEETEYQRQLLEEGEIGEPLSDFQGLDTASGLDTSPEWDLASPGEYTEEAASFHSVIRKAADFLELPLPMEQVKTNILTEVLHPATAIAAPLLPFNEALMDPIVEIWKKPFSSSAVSRSVARRYRSVPGDPEFLSKHPSPESLVVQASCSSRSAPGSFPGVPSDRESKHMEQSAKKVFSSCSMALISADATCFLGRYIHAIMDAANAAWLDMPQDLQGLLLNAQSAATQVIQSGLDTTDSVARAMGTSNATRRQAWLRTSGFSSDVQAMLLDLPFDGAKLFGTKADSALERFKECRATAKSLGLQAVSTPFRPFRRLRVFGQEASFRGRSQQAAQQPSSLPYRSFRGRGVVRTRGATQQQHPSSSSTSGGMQQGKQP